MLFLNLCAYTLLLGCPILCYHAVNRWSVPRRWHLVLLCGAAGAAAAVLLIGGLLLMELSHFATLRPDIFRFTGEYTAVGCMIGVIGVATPEWIWQRLVMFSARLPRDMWRHRREVVVATLCALLIQAGGAWVYAKLNPEPSPYVHVDAPAHAAHTTRLPDESQVVLAPGSHLSYTNWFTPHDQSELTLNGEATFRVARTGQTRLVLQARGVEVTAMKAHFTVRAFDAASIAYVTVHEGRVNLRARSDSSVSKFVMLRSGESARVGPKLQVVPADSTFLLHR